MNQVTLQREIHSGASDDAFMQSLMGNMFINEVFMVYVVTTFIQNLLLTGMIGKYTGWHSEMHTYMSLCTPQLEDYGG